MRRACLALLVLLVSAIPAQVLARSQVPSAAAAYSMPCTIHVGGEDSSTVRHVRCTAGIASNVSRTGMKVKPSRGKPLSVRFTRATVFQTDSGEGALNGLANGDHVCVGYNPRPGTVTALLVAFDPESNPCRSGKSPDS